MYFPLLRLRRLRMKNNLRRMKRETRLDVSNLIYPIFVQEGKGIKQEIQSMPGIYRFSIDTVEEEIAKVIDADIPAIILFGIPAEKDSTATQAWVEDGIIQRATRFIKDKFPELIVITDVCLCEYTDHGHCGLVRDGKVLNDETLDIIQKIALSQVEAGSDMVAPSGMMDGAVGAIREILDENGYGDVPIMAYAAKFFSSFYGPFRDAAESAPAFGDRRSYQMDPANFREAMLEMELDVREGADIIMVKPALPYLDVIKEARSRFDLPIAAYQVSGEYSMIKAAAKLGWLDERRAMWEATLSIRRAGADMILTYFALELSKMIKEGWNEV